MAKRRKSFGGVAQHPERSRNRKTRKVSVTIRVGRSASILPSINKKGGYMAFACLSRASTKPGRGHCGMPARGKTPTKAIAAALASMARMLEKKG